MITPRPFRLEQVTRYYDHYGQAVKHHRQRATTRSARYMLADPCVYCGGTTTGLDHILPRSQRGSDGWHNRAPACRTCDSAKGSATLLSYLRTCTKPLDTPVTPAPYCSTRFSTPSRGDVR